MSGVQRFRSSYDDRVGGAGRVGSVSTFSNYFLRFFGKLQ
jgi:hypothetical protein